MALAHHFEELLDTHIVETQAKIAELARLTPARVTQIMNLLDLAPDIQEEILFLPPVTETSPPGEGRRQVDAAQRGPPRRRARSGAWPPMTDLALGMQQ